jgi:hypothetical protein
VQTGAIAERWEDGPRGLLDSRQVSAASADMGMDRLKLRRSSIGGSAIRNVAPLGRQAVEAGLGDAQLRPAFDSSSSNSTSLRSNSRRVHQSRAGASEAIDRHVPGQVLVARMCDAPRQTSARCELAVEVYAEPGAELARRCQRLPHPGNRGAQENIALDASQVGAHVSSGAGRVSDLS